MSQKEFVNDIMSSHLLTIRLDDSVRKAYEMMKERRIRHLPVCDEARQIIGIISDRDLQRAMKPKQLTVMSNLDDDIEFDPSHQVKDFMSWPVNCVAYDIEIAAAVRRMLNQKISALLVVDGHQKPIGIVTTEDMLKLLAELLEKGPSGLKLSFQGIFSDSRLGSGNLS